MNVINKERKIKLRDAKLKAIQNRMLNKFFLIILLAVLSAGFASLGNTKLEVFSCLLIGALLTLRQVGQLYGIFYIEWLTTAFEVFDDDK